MAVHHLSIKSIGIECFISENPESVRIKRLGRTSSTGELKSIDIGDIGSESSKIDRFNVLVKVRAHLLFAGPPGLVPAPQGVAFSTQADTSGQNSHFWGNRGYFISIKGVETPPKAGVVQKYFKLATAQHFLDFH